MVERLAHDLNNLLTVILGNATMIRLDLAPDAPGHLYVDQIEEAVRQAVVLTDRLADSSFPPEPSPDDGDSTDY